MGPCILVMAFNLYVYITDQANASIRVSSEGKKGVSAGRHLLALVEDVLDIAKIEEDRLTLHPNDISLSAFVQGLQAIVVPLAAKNGNDFQIVHTNIEPSSRLFHDETRLRQVLVNLLGNAANFTQEGHITLEIQETIGYIVFRVIDTGIGISREQLARMFEEFEQGDAQVAKRFGGAGLGLPISKKLSQLMGGHLSCTSPLGQGTTFELRLPKTAQIPNKLFAGQGMGA